MTLKTAFSRVWLLLTVWGLSTVPTGQWAAAAGSASIASLLKPAVLSRILNEREAVAVASLAPDQQGMQRYSFYGSMLAHASFKQTRQVLTDYKLYSKLIPYIDKTVFDEKTRVLELEGGLWKFRLRSWIHFEEETEHSVRYRIIGGHFQGLEGQLLFESRGEKGTLVYFDGAQIGKTFPPKFVIERGAEIVFGFTARRMRSYIESLKTESFVPGRQEGESPHGANSKNEIPKPRSHL